MKKKFKIYQNGVQYKSPKNSVVVMNAQGLFFLIWCDFCTPAKELHEVIGDYDVVWKGEEIGE